jgi:nitrate/nitrite-specific signal transduction histidine kinase
MNDLKSIKKLYKNTPRPMGIYQVKNLASGKVYIGRAMDLSGRLNSERFQLKNNLHMNRELQEDFNELGMEKFSFEVLDRLQPKENPGIDQSRELKELEDMWLEKLQPYAGRGYHKEKP